MNKIRDEGWWNSWSTYYCTNMGVSYYLGAYNDLGVHELHLVVAERTRAQVCTKDARRKVVADTWANVLANLPKAATTLLFSDAYYGERYSMDPRSGYYGGVSPRRISTWRMWVDAPEEIKAHIRKLYTKVNPNSGHAIALFIFDVAGYRKSI